jgi:hypothetical protein
MTEPTLDEQFEAVSQKFEDAKSRGVSRPTSRWTWVWRSFIAVGISLTLIFAAYVLYDLNQLAHENNVLLQAHSSEITAIENDFNSKHNESYPVIVSICQHTPGCVVPTNPAGPSSK